MHPPWEPVAAAAEQRSLQSVTITRPLPWFGRQEAVLCAPMDRRLPLLRLRTRRGPELVGNRFLLRLDAWPPGSYFPEAHLVHILGGLGDLQ